MMKGVQGAEHRASGPGRGRTAVAARCSVAAVLVLQLALFPVPLGVWVQGLILGLLGSLMAVGLGLVYRLNKVINFSQGDLGTAPAVLAVGLIGFSGVNYFLGLAHRPGRRRPPHRDRRDPGRSAASGVPPASSSPSPPLGSPSSWS